ncbi:MAG: isoleucine--tRNA ligase [Caldilineales bacterium]|nr:isoleucine--tRNA ligase [Caldilineales bacterium]
MSFQDVPTDVDFVAQEHETLAFWKQSDAFNKLRALRKGSPPWSFIDGPITANNPMGVHHGWGRTYKDITNRFWSMQGRELRYQQGFDCQGLWVEVEVEKEFGFKSKKDIEDYGLEAFVRRCKARVLRYSAVQTEQSIRLGYWMDWNDTDQLRMFADLMLNDPTQELTVEGPEGQVTGTVENLVGRLGMPEMGGSYYTFATENNYMIWTFLKKCWEKGWLYQGADVMPWCPRCATAISQHEIVTDGYREITHRSVTLRFPLRERPGESLLVWTTTPWTLTSNVAAAVGADLDYVKVRNGEHVLYLSKGTLHMLRGKFEVLGQIKGRDMVGWTYDGPFDDLPAAQTPGGFHPLSHLDLGNGATAAATHQVIAWDGVGESEGTGIVHIAPGCGAEDFDLGKQHNFPVLAPLNDESDFVDGYGWLAGMHVSDVADPIFEDLEKKGVIYQIEPYSHRYPTCWRCATELVFRLVDEWFISMGELYDKPREEVTAEEKARSLRYQIMDVVDDARWIPEFGHARELDWLRNMHDWMISKKRYWGLALPFWVCEDCGDYHVVGDEIELEARAVRGWDEFKGHTPHRPYVDAVKLQCESCGGLMHRIADVGNPWLDAGIVSFSTLQYRRNPEFWRKWFPAHWISESFPGQFRNWFYSLLAMSTVIAEAAPFRQLFGYASLLAEDGREMHKSWGNSIEFNEAADRMGVDTMRWLYSSQKPENNLLFGYHRADDARRRVLIPLWNVYNFFVTYAKLDGWQPATAAFDPAQPEGRTPVVSNPLDRWILARLNQVVARVSDGLTNSDAFTATLAVEGLLEDLTNWYVRRSRRRFWKGEADADKEQAYATLYHTLVKLIRTIAPIMPFAPETMYQNLVRNVQPDARLSIHHTDWPKTDPSAIDQSLLDQMSLARRITSLGLSARSGANLRVRQPLAKALVHVQEGRSDLSAELIEIVADELNVKAIEFVTDPGALVSYRILPNNRLLGPKLGRDFPKARTALEALSAATVARQVESGQPVEITIDGEVVELLSEEVLVQTDPAEGLAVVADKVLTVAIDSTITPDLKAEGFAREVVRRIQTMRKNAEFNIEDRIQTWYATDDAELAQVLADWHDYIATETLSDELGSGKPPADAYTETHSVEGAEVVVGVKRR